MALHWEELKGFYGEIAGGGDLLYTYIRFQKEASSATTTNENSRPTIALQKNGSSEISLGYILCNAVDNYLDAHLYFNQNKGLYFCTSGLPNNFNNTYYWAKVLSGHDLSIYLPDTNTTYTSTTRLFQGTYKNSSRNVLQLMELTDKSLWFRTGEFIIDTWFNNTNANYTKHEVKFQVQNLLNEISSRSGAIGQFQVYTYDGSTYKNYVHISPNDDNSYMYRFTSSAMYSTNPIHAYYFDATSDKRAKENINLLTSSALKIVNQTPIYTFNYKKNQQASVGILAQDIQDINLNGFNLVDNRDATGENEDYMQIHESKLVYVLWKAVQELSSEVENLKKQLNK